MDKNLLKDILLIQSKKQFEKGIVRTLQTDVDSFKKDSFVIIVSGIRRCGKSTLLQNVRTDNMYYVDFDDERFINFTVDDFQTLYELLIELFGEKDIFIFDEIQNILSWERFVRRLHDDGKKIYVTGSNASMLSKELGTHLTGRNISLTLYPFSFKEFLTYNNYDIPNITKLTSTEKSKLKNQFNKFLQEGGFPEFIKTKKEDYLKNLYENIIYRDIIARYNLKSEKAIKETVFFAASNIGKEISFNNLKNLTGLSSATTIKEYFEYLENSYLVFLISKYDSSLKKQIYNNKKVYFIDNKLAQIVGFRSTEDYGRLLENLVFIELKKQNQDIYFHKEKLECDFVIRQSMKITQAIQVTKSLSDEKTRQREINGLLDALKSYKLKEGLILTDNEEDEFTQDGFKIIVKPVWKWLLKKL